MPIARAQDAGVLAPVKGRARRPRHARRERRDRRRASRGPRPLVPARGSGRLRALPCPPLRAPARDTRGRWADAPPAGAPDSACAVILETASWSATATFSHAPAVRRLSVRRRSTRWRRPTPAELGAPAGGASAHRPRAFAAAARSGGQGRAEPAPEPRAGARGGRRRGSPCRPAARSEHGEEPASTPLPGASTAACCSRDGPTPRCSACKSGCRRRADPINDSEAVRRRRAAERSSVVIPCGAPPTFATLHVTPDPASGARRRRVLLAIAEPSFTVPANPASGARRRRVLLAIAELSLHAMLTGPPKLRLAADTRGSARLRARPTVAVCHNEASAAGAGDVRPRGSRRSPARFKACKPPVQRTT